MKRREVLVGNYYIFSNRPFTTSIYISIQFQKTLRKKEKEKQG